MDYIIPIVDFIEIALYYYNYYSVIHSLDKNPFQQFE